MKTFILENEKISVRVSSKGAELQSLYSKETELEYMWQPGADIFAHHSILLFPNPGRIAQDRTIINGRIYPAKMHGFANEMEFEVVSQKKDSLVLSLEDNDITRVFFPYAFQLLVEFCLDGETLKQRFYVVNKNEGEMYYSLGAHPGFYCPLEINESADDYTLSFNPPQTMNELELEENTRLLTGNNASVHIDEKEIPLNEDYFGKGPKIFGGLNAETITLRSKKTGKFIEMGVKNFPYLCLWGMPTRMSVICIEPWCGVSDYCNTNHIWEEKPGIVCAQKGQTNTHEITFKIG